MMYAHQQKIINEDPLKKGLFLGTGSGKTKIAVALAKGKTLVICPKQQAVDNTWTKEWVKQEKTDELLVLSKEKFKKNSAPVCDTLIIDECHTCCGVTPYTRQKHYQKFPKASQIYETTIKYVRTAYPERIYLLSATPVPQPMAVWALGQILGKKWDYYKFRQQFYREITMRGRTLYMPDRSEKNKVLMDKLKSKIGYVGGLSSFVDIPDQVFKEHKVGMTLIQRQKLVELKLLYPDPLVQIGKRHQLEQGIFEGEMLSENKAEAIEQYFLEFGKLIVFAKYTAQIEYLRKRFNRLTRVFVLNGKTKANERATMMKDAETCYDCIVIAQSSVSAGWELPTFPCMIFASHSYSYVDYEQGLGRIQRINNVKKNIYISLIAGAIDEKVMKTVKSKKDFSEIAYEKKRSK